MSSNACVLSLLLSVLWRCADNNNNNNQNGYPRDQSRRRYFYGGQYYAYGQGPYAQAAYYEAPVSALPIH